MIKLKTNLSFDISLEHKLQETVTRTTKRISKLFVVAKEIISKRRLKS